jgi:hypothetical protein
MLAAIQTFARSKENEDAHVRAAKEYAHLKNELEPLKGLPVMDEVQFRSFEASFRQRWACIDKAAPLLPGSYYPDADAPPPIR